MKLSSRPLRVGAAVVSVASAAVGLKRHTLRNELKPDLVMACSTAASGT